MYVPRKYTTNPLEQKPVDPSKLSPACVLALITGVHMGCQGVEHAAFLQLIELCQPWLSELSLSDLTTLLWRCTCISDVAGDVPLRGVPLTFVQAQARVWTQRFEQAVDAVGGVEGTRNTRKLEILEN